MSIDEKLKAFRKALKTRLAHCPPAVLRDVLVLLDGYEAVTQQPVEFPLTDEAIISDVYSKYRMDEFGIQPLYFEQMLSDFAHKMQKKATERESFEEAYEWAVKKSKSANVEVEFIKDDIGFKIRPLENWQPIKTAPEDGTEIIGYIAPYRDKKGKVVIGKILSVGASGKNWGDGARYINYGGGGYDQIAMWMPMLEAPNTTQIEGD